MAEIIFKQSFKPLQDARTPMLNQAHVRYIATRPGVMLNRDSGFGLWGQLPGQAEPQDQTDLAGAIRAVGRASRQSTMLRCIVSVDGDTAVQHGLYQRQNWEDMVRQRLIPALCREMHMDPAGLHWLASMHYKAGHPHVHICYWDDSGRPLEPYLSPQRFTLVSQRIRAACSAYLHGPEILADQRQQTEISQEMRRQLRASILQLNPHQALSLGRVRGRDELGEGLYRLICTAPAKGRLAYRYVSADYKAQLNTWIRQVLAKEPFADLARQHAALAREVATLYGNSDVEARVAKAQEKLHIALGNEVLGIVREAVQHWELGTDVQGTDLEQLVRHLLRQSGDTYQTLLERLPAQRVPYKVFWQQPELRQMAQTVLGDLRLRRKAESQPEPEEAMKEARRAMYHQIAADKGWQQQAASHLLGLALIRLFAALGQSTNQAQAQRDLRQRRRDMAKEAKKDLAVQRQQGGAQQER